MQSGDDVFETVRIGTRGSKLSLWQANHVADLIRDCHGDRPVEIKTYRTRGDENQNAALPLIGGKGLFTEALENALRRREIDFAVHSLKDLPVENADGLTIGAVPKRGDHRDGLLSRSGCALAQLPTGARLGTGSLRRRAQLLALRPDLRMLDIRGNVPTRIDKLMMDDGPYDAIVLAAAGLNRLGLADHISEVLDTTQMISAAGQGALAVQCRDDGDSLAFLARVADAQTAQAIEAERTFLRALGDGCSLPVGVYAYVKDNRLLMRGRVTSLDGRRQIDVAGEAHVFDGPSGVFAARQLGTSLAQETLEKGGRQILDSVSPGALSAGEE
ncbi:MAG: hydroxymethylbilane synthase [Chloroflexota bacterium]|nr:hydroxymethylbilane synthase [Chloroflexota bacterium]